MDRAHPQPVVPSAPAPRASTKLITVARSRLRRRTDPPHRPASDAGDDTGEHVREQLRARLLRMILENERVRRSETRANAS